MNNIVFFGETAHMCCSCDNVIISTSKSLPDGWVTESIILNYLVKSNTINVIQEKIETYCNKCYTVRRIIK